MASRLREYIMHNRLCLSSLIELRMVALRGGRFWCLFTLFPSFSLPGRDPLVRIQESWGKLGFYIEKVHSHQSLMTCRVLLRFTDTLPRNTDARTLSLWYGWEINPLTEHEAEFWNCNINSLSGCLSWSCTTVTAFTWVYVSKLSNVSTRKHAGKSKVQPRFGIVANAQKDNKHSQ